LVLAEGVDERKDGVSTQVVADEVDDVGCSVRFRDALECACEIDAFAR
jgi:hypothetical protein